MQNLLILIILLLPSLAWGACGGTTPNLTAASANRGDVVDCVTAATYGDTINIPAGTGTGWTSGVTITKDLKIKGAGVESTFIDVEITGQDTGVFIFSPDADAETNIKTLSSPGLFEITGITFTNLIQTIGNQALNVEVLNIVGADVSQVIKKIRIHHNRVICMSHVLGIEVGYAHGLIDNNYLFNSSLAYAGASTYSLNNLIYPGDGGGWYFEDNVHELSSSSMRRGTVSAAKVKTDEFKYWIAHTLYTASASETSLPEGTIPTGKYGIFKLSIDTSGNYTITAGSANGVGYASAADAIAALPATPEGQYHVGSFTIYNNSGEVFTNGTTNLNATGVTTTFGENDTGGYPVGGGNNRGAAHTYRYNKVFGTFQKSSDYSASAYGGLTAAFFDNHSNQLGYITGGQNFIAYGNNLVATFYDGNINTVIESGLRGQKNILFYNLFPENAEADTDIFFTEEYNDAYSVGDATPGSESTIAALAALNMCASRTTSTGSPTQSCPGYYIGLPDRTATRCGCWKVHDSYIVNNRKIGGTLMTAKVVAYDHFHHNNSIENNPVELLEDREFFNYVALGSFDGSAGVTCGTTAQMNAITPATTGVGFWVPTNIATMPCTEVLANNIKQTEGVAPVTPITGTLYKWDGDSWEAFWIPYTYPHPLRNESSGTGAAVSIGSGSVMSIGGGATATLY